MGPQSPSSRPGEGLKKLRVSVGLTMREVERRSQRLADSKGNPIFLVSHSWLRILENGTYVPGIHKFYALSVIYHRSCEELLSLFGVNLADAAKDQAMFDWPATHLASTSTGPESGKIPFPVRMLQETTLEENQLSARLVQMWGEVPVSLIRQLDVRKSLYGYLGMQDYSLFPLVLPGSLLQIDPNDTKVKVGKWRHDWERPIYFIDLRKGYGCGWCELKNGELTLVPHLLSPQPTRRFSYPHEAEIIGRVTGVAMRIANGELSPLRNLPQDGRGRHRAGPGG